MGVDARGGANSIFIGTLIQGTQQKVGAQPYNPDAPPTPALFAEFYFPLSLGREVVEKVEPNDPREAPPPLEPLTYKEGQNWRRRFEQQPEERVLESWLAQPGLHPLVGEPGSGKSTLLRQWAVRLNEQHLQDGTKPVAFYVALRDVTSEGLDDYFGRPRADGGFELDITPFLSPDPPARAIWLFDGLDELPQELRGQWFTIIQTCSKDVCVVSCRTAVYRGEFGDPMHLMGLAPAAQLSFLRDLVGLWRQQRYPPEFAIADDSWVERLHGAIQGNAQLAPLAGSPLLLTLLAFTHPPTSDLDLATSRPDFYRQVFEKLIA